MANTSFPICLLAWLAIDWVIGLSESEIADHIMQAIMPLTQIELQQKAMTLKVTGVKSSQSVGVFQKFLLRINHAAVMRLIFNAQCISRMEHIHYFKSGIDDQQY